VSHDHGSKQCKEIFAQLSEYLDGELDPGMCDRLDGHLKGCPPCEVFLESLKRTVGLVGSLESTVLDDDTRRKVVETYRRLREGSSTGEPPAGEPPRD
jgi:RNA polymerase sigma-70 factor (ECF subfamily)